MPAPLINYIHIALSSMTVYCFLLIAIRLFGRNELSQLSVIDLVFVLLISNAVQNAMVGPDSSLSGGLVAASALFVVNLLLKRLFHRFPKLNKMVEGHAIMLIYQGQLNMDHALKAHLSFDDIMEAIREHGISDIEQVDLCVLEVDGNISVISNDYKKVSQHKRKIKKTIKQNID